MKVEKSNRSRLRNWNGWKLLPGNLRLRIKLQLRETRGRGFCRQKCGLGKTPFHFLFGSKGISVAVKVPHYLQRSFPSQIFEKLREESPDVLEKLVPIEGDVSQEDLALSKADSQLLAEEVSVVIHLAATLKLDAALKDAIVQNTLGTQRVLQLGKQMAKLEVGFRWRVGLINCSIERSRQLNVFLWRGLSASF